MQEPFENDMVVNSLKIVKADIACSLNYMDESYKLLKDDSDSYYSEYLQALALQYHSLVLWELNHMATFGLINLKDRGELLYKYILDRKKIKQKYLITERTEKQ